MFLWKPNIEKVDQTAEKIYDFQFAQTVNNSRLSNGILEKILNYRFHNVYVFREIQYLSNPKLYVTNILTMVSYPILSLHEHTHECWGL